MKIMEVNATQAPHTEALALYANTIQPRSCLGPNGSTAFPPKQSQNSAKVANLLSWGLENCDSGFKLTFTER